MTQNPTMKGQRIYEYELDITGVTDCGVTMDAILAGKESVPLQGARNARQIWSVGTTSLTAGKIYVEAYMQLRRYRVHHLSSGNCVS